MKEKLRLLEYAANSMKEDIKMSMDYYSEIKDCLTDYSDRLNEIIKLVEELKNEKNT